MSWKASSTNVFGCCADPLGIMSHPLRHPVRHDLLFVLSADLYTVDGQNSASLWMVETPHTHRQTQRERERDR